MKKVLLPVFLILVVVAAFMFYKHMTGSAEGEQSTPAAETASVGDSVTVHYVGTLDDGEQFDSSRETGREPLTFVIGDGNMIDGFDQGVRGMEVGETKDVKIAPENAYGEAIIVEPLPIAYFEDLLPDTELVAGIEETTTNGIDIKIVEVTETEVTIEYDNPHPLAGESLNFEIEMLSIE